MSSPFRNPGSRLHDPDRHPALGVEALERRDTPSATASVVGGVLVIQGTPSADTVTVRMDPGGPSAFDDRVVVTFSRFLPTQSFSRFLVSHIGFLGGAGDDTFTNQTGIDCTAWGGDGHDTLTGGSGDDYLYGNDGPDELHGGDGSDHLYGGRDDDVMYGDAGDDTLDDWCDRYTVELFADPADAIAQLFPPGATAQILPDGAYEQGNDWLYGGDGKDTLHGRSGNDHLSGGMDLDADVLWGDTGADTFAPDFIQVFGHTVNLDNPQDSHTAEGDGVATWFHFP